MKEILLVVCLFIGFQSLYAQGSSILAPKGTGKIYGVVMDSTHRTPVEFATVAIIDPATQKPINGTICDGSGKFLITKLAKGNYQIEISFIGFETKKIKVILSDKKSDIDLGSIQISSSIKILEEVVVQGQRQIVEEKVDRTIYNAENDLTAKGGDATDVLKRVPLLSVDIDGNVSLRGSSNVKVLINNKPSTITASSIGDALKQIPADMIKNVEVITSPSSKYDAEGSAGIINIVLKKNTLEGFFLTVDGTLGSRGSNGSVNGSYRKGKMGFSLGGFSRELYNIKGYFENHQTTMSNGDTATNVQNTSTRSNGSNSQYTFGWDYDINKSNSLTVSARYGQRSLTAYQDLLYTQKFHGETLLNSNLQNVRSTNTGDNVDVSMTYTKTFLKKDRDFNFLAIYSRNNANTGFVSDSLSQTNYSILKSYKNENEGHTQEITLQADFQEPIKQNQLIEFGAKDIVRNVTSEYRYLIAQGTNGEYLPSSQPLLSNGFNYDQSITSGYLSYSNTSIKNYTIKAGGRYEYTNIVAHFQNQPNISIPSYGVLVPSLNISRKLSNGNLIKVSYNKRIQRPTLQELNPNLIASNRLNATIGNPNLKPEYTDNYEIAYNTHVKGSTLNFSTYLRHNSNDIQQARTIRHDTIISSFQNIGTEANFGASIFASVPVSSRFSISGGIDVYYRILKNNSPDPSLNATNSGFVKNIRVFGSYNFSKGWGLQFFSFFQGRNYNLQGYRTNPINHSLAVKKDIWKKAGYLGLGIDNFATPSYQVYSELKSAYLVQSTTTTLYNFIVKVNFSYKIGKLNVEKKRKSLIEEDN